MGAMRVTGADDPAELIRRVVEAVQADDLAPAAALLALAGRIDAALVADAPPLRLPALEALASPAPAGGALDRALTDGAGDGAPLAPEVIRASGPRLLGLVHEALLDAAHRHRRGVFYTPPDVASGLVRTVFARHDDPSSPRPPASGVTVCDPALGGGVFLLAAADELLARGLPPVDIVERHLWGIDLDPLAVAVGEAALILWARGHGATVRGTNLVEADTLVAGAAAWAEPPVDGFTIVIGNPPFQNQLGTGTARTADETERLRDRLGAAVFRYTDSAALFLLAASQLAAPGGIIALIVPVPVLVTGDADRVRRELLADARLEHLWIGDDEAFDAGVRVGAPVLRLRSDPTGPGRDHEPDRGAVPEALTVTRSFGRGFTPLPAKVIGAEALRAGPTWGALVADVFGVPLVASVRAGDGRLGDLCAATAGFRDQYYGLRPFVAEAPIGSDGDAAPVGGRFAALVTSGLIEPARCVWGARTTRFAGRTWVAPVVDLDALEREDEALAAWTRARLVPKLVVATQTRVLEAAVDVDGTWFPSVPTIAVSAEPERLWEVAAVVLAPSTTVWAMNRHVGAALSADALKVSASQLLEAPLPVDRDTWTEGARILRDAAAAGDGSTWRGALERFGAAMAVAYAAPDDVLPWWRDRLPRWR